MATKIARPNSLRIDMTEMKNKPLVVRKVMRKVEEKCQACLAKSGGQVN